MYSLYSGCNSGCDSGCDSGDVSLGITGFVISFVRSFLLAVERLIREVAIRLFRALGLVSAGGGAFETELSKEAKKASC